MKKTQSVHDQRGAGLLSTLIFLTAIGCVGTIVLKSVPAYLEYWSIKSALKSILLNTSSEDEMRVAFDKRAIIDNIVVIKSSDLTIDDGEIRVAYQKVVPLYSNISLMFEFSASSKE